MRVPALSLRWRLAGLFTLGFGLLLAAGGLGLHTWLAHDYRAEFDADLAASATAFAELHHQELAYFPDAWAAAEHAVSELLFPDRLFVALRDDGTLATSRGLELAEMVVPQLAGQLHEGAFDLMANGVPFRVLRRPLADDVTAYVVLSRAPLDALLNDLATALGVGLPAILLLGAIIGAAGARRALRPVAKVAAAAGIIADEVAAGRDTFTRPRPAPVDDEVGQLTSALNGLADRLGPALRRERKLVEEQRRFLAGAAHELRMPVTILRSEAEVALQGPSDPDEHRAALERIEREAVGLSTLVDDLLLLARADSVEFALRPERFFMDDVATDTLRRLSRHPSARNRRLRLGDFEPAPAAGDRVLVERALGVLIHNALVHAAPSDVVVRAGSDATGSWVEVSDQGPGIEPADAERVFERFVRLDTTTPGTGLGLPIARWIATLHGGTLTLDSTPGAGSRFVLRLPVA